MYRSAVCVCSLCWAALVEEQAGRDARGETRGAAVTELGHGADPGPIRAPSRSRSRSRSRGRSGAGPFPFPFSLSLPGRGRGSDGRHLAGDRSQGPAAPARLPAVLPRQGGTGKGPGASTGIAPRRPRAFPRPPLALQPLPGLSPRPRHWLSRLLHLSPGLPDPSLGRLCSLSPSPSLSALPGPFPFGPHFLAQVRLPGLDLPDLSPAWSVPPAPARPPRSGPSPPGPLSLPCLLQPLAACRLPRP